MPSECRRCGGQVRLVTAPGERVPELRCRHCGHEYVPPKGKGHKGRAGVQAKLQPRRQAVVRLRLQGLTPAQIADRLGVPKNVVHADLRRLGMGLGMQKLPTATIERIHELALQGTTRIEIARVVGVCYQTVWAHVAPLVQQGRPVGYDAKRAHALRLLAVGRAMNPPMPYQTIADRVGVSYHTICRWAKAANLEQGAPQHQRTASRNHATATGPHRPPARAQTTYRATWGTWGTGGAPRAAGVAVRGRYAG